MSNLWYPSVKESPFQGFDGFGGGASGLLVAGAAEDTGSYSVTFSGNDQGLLVPDNDAWNLGQTFTIEALLLLK